jgi:predicted  nucleic acid-binding Zn-ribbon protein
MSSAFGLLRLQQVDSRISQMEARRREIREILENDAELAAATERLKVAEREQAEAENERQTAEAQAASQRVKIEQAESSLYGGKVGNPKELQELQADIASLRKHLGAIEDLELAALERTEAAEAGILAARTALEQVRSRLVSEHLHLTEEQATLERDLEGSRAERHAALTAVGSEDLRAYEDLRNMRRGLAVAEIADNACMACGTILTAAQQQSARHSPALVFCPTCGRILYAG